MLRRRFSSLLARDQSSSAHHNFVIAKLQGSAAQVDLQGKPLRLNTVLEHLAAIPDDVSWMTPAERLLLFSLVLSLRPRWYLEIGTFKGGSALIACAAMNAAENREGKLILIDPNAQIAPEHWSFLEERSLLIKEPSPAALRCIPPEARGQIAFALIDGDHSFQGALSDARAVLPLMCPGGMMVFHDGFYDEVRRAIDQFVQEHTDQVTDYGLFSREYVGQVLEDGQQVKWGGLRLVFVRGASTLT